MAKKKPVKLSKKEVKYRNKISELRSQDEQTRSTPVVEKTKKSVRVPKVVAIRKMAELSGINPSSIIQVLFKNGMNVTINQSIDFETAVLIGHDLGLEIEEDNAKANESILQSVNGQKRPPIVTIMGHVDHGKTSLLDTIRKTNILATESGGITQHIGAYQAEVVYENEKRKITFLDTPGHEAFSALRAHGANITDIIVLVVAANDGVKAQTLEAISHAKAAQVPIIVAINKIDLPDADIEKIKGQLAEKDIVAEKWGGNIPFVEISAKQNLNINKLLDIILLVADMRELKADYDGLAQGIVIESNIDSKSGITATLLIQSGTLKLQDIIVAGDSWGKIRSIKDWHSRPIRYGKPSDPVVITGLKEIPRLGDRFNVVSDEKSVKKLLSDKERISHDLVSEQGDRNEFKIIIKADVVGSLEAIKSSINDISEDKIKINILGESVGEISENDINKAITSNAHIFGFRVDISSSAKILAKRQNINIKIFDTIYKLIDDLYLLIESEILPEITENIVAKLEILKIFFQSGDRAIIGGKIVEGEATKDLKIRFIDNGNIIGEGAIKNIKIGPSEVDKVEKNSECGIEVTKNKTNLFKISIGQKAEIVKVSKSIAKLVKKQNINN